MDPLPPLSDCRSSNTLQNLKMAVLAEVSGSIPTWQLQASITRVPRSPLPPSGLDRHRTYVMHIQTSKNVVVHRHTQSHSKSQHISLVLSSPSLPPTSPLTCPSSLLFFYFFRMLWKLDHIIWYCNHGYLCFFLHMVL